MVRIFSASVAACFRLAHTVAFASQADSIYLIGPLLFWADAEMTCGFFIFSVPCLSKLIMESGVRQKFFGTLGLTSLTTNRAVQGSGSTPNSRGSRNAKHWMSTTDTTWSRIDEEHVGLDDQSDSQKNLCVAPKQHDEGDGIQVHRTMNVTVSEGRPSVNTNRGNITPWK